jgi:hypothetical protein
VNRLRVVPTGAGSSRLLEHYLHGVDVDARCVQIAALAVWLRAQRAWKDAGVGRARLDRVVAADADAFLREIQPESPFDCVIPADVLEHLVDPWTVVERVGDTGPGSHVHRQPLPNVFYRKALWRTVRHARWPRDDQGIFTARACGASAETTPANCSRPPDSRSPRSCRVSGRRAGGSCSPSSSIQRRSDRICSRSRSSWRCSRRSAQIAARDGNGRRAQIKLATCDEAVHLCSHSALPEGVEHPLHRGGW